MVRRGCKGQAMDIDTQNHLKALRDLLEYRLRDLRSEIRGEQAVRPGDALSGVTDMKDRAEREQISAVAESEERRDWSEIAAVEGALRRLEQGGYGDCLACGEPIPIKRLLVQPAAKLCVACQHEQDRNDALARAP